MKTLDLFRLEIMGLAVQMCERKQNQEIFKLLPNLYVNDSVYVTMTQILPDLQEMIVECKFFDKWRNCSDIIYPTLTGKGFCFSFNAIALSEYLTDEYVQILTLIEKRKFYIDFDLFILLQSICKYFKLST